MEHVTETWDIAGQAATMGAGDGGGEVDGWATYMRELGRVRRLTPDEELALGARISGGDDAALRRMVEANPRLVIAVAKRYRHEGIGMQDFVQEGNIGLLRAAQKFDHRKGYRFSTYAIWWIRQAVSRAVANQAYAIRVPVHIQEGLGQAERLLAGAQTNGEIDAARDTGSVGDHHPRPGANRPHHARCATRHSRRRRAGHRHHAGGPRAAPLFPDPA